MIMILDDDEDDHGDNNDNDNITTGGVIIMSIAHDNANNDNDFVKCKLQENRKSKVIIAYHSAYNNFETYHCLTWKSYVLQ